MSLRRSLAITIALVAIIGACAGPPDGSAPASSSPSPTVPAAPADPTAPPCPAPPSLTPDASDAWWTDRVFYEVFVRSFADSDGDGIGDLVGLTQRLDALNDGDPATTNDLGVTALWLMPVAASPSYHGYDVIDYLTIEPDYGTNDDFRALVVAARARGIEIVVDLVMNHTSVEHPWFQDARTPGSEHEDWYLWADAFPGFSGPAGRPVWHRDGDRWYYGYFWEGMPDLDLTNPAVTTEMDAIARFWVDEMGVAGFRLDAARHLIEDGSTLENVPATFDRLRAFRGRLQGPTPDALVLGEVWEATSMASRYVREGALDLTFDFDLASQMLQAVRNGDPGSLRIIQSAVTAAYPPGTYAAFLSNHDQDRVFDVVGRDAAKARQAATLLLTNPGVPFIYYGEEVGLRGRKPDERIRTPLPWTGDAPGYGFTRAVAPWQAMAEGVETANVAAQADDPASLLSHYRTLIRLRDAHPALGTRGAMIHLDVSEPGIYAVLRHDAASGEAIVVVSNLTRQPVDDVRLSVAEGPLCGTLAVDTLFAGPGSTGPVLPPDGTATGGFEDWAFGDLGPNEDLIVRLAP